MQKDPATGDTRKVFDTIAAYYEATLLAGFGETEARRFFGRPQGISPDGLPLTPWPAKRAQLNFLKRFRLLEEAHGHDAARRLSERAR